MKIKTIPIEDIRIIIIKPKKTIKITRKPTEARKNTRAKNYCQKHSPKEQISFNPYKLFRKGYHVAILLTLIAILQFPGK